MTVNIKFKYSYIIKLIYVLIIIIFITAGYLLVDFLNINFYQVITQAEDIIILRSEVATEIVDVALFEKILVRLKEKQKPLPFDIKNVRGVFKSPSKQEVKERGLTSPKDINKILNLNVTEYNKF